ncbi:aspartyl-phosphate phosphatase Spo0E family protein [Aquibacillus koreensis]|uniref:Aspartyl-phosphate phosphatase Spo0E family protein n=1 Tax=Aquibacillus koreensis TaxID=279446 RepID=A0A9X4AIX1_9BACI|nr:aspartyl-phosphate phosphatase Spo0E family protein [Aquibacillus koreensis]MCT2537803.1 aspartyl-phosphate phosphatase Spo0E family protein [Aquibacillus koreensis]MDC3421164.1 aspartyl-phosphate phosphatase Spo0E family protein [Aquibacillus koreensis]
MNNQILLTKISSKRNEMIKVGLTEGLTSKETIRCSQELDQLLNMYEGNREKFTFLAV